VHFLGLQSEGFRNLEPFKLTFHPAVNWFYGANGQGKTNFLESLLYIVSGRSHRGARDEDLVSFDGDYFFLSGELQDDGGDDLNITASFAGRGKKKIKLMGEEITRLSELVSVTGTVVFGPGDVELVTGEPEKRRRFLDYSLAKTDPGYLRDLLTYRRVVRQRNALLRDLNSSRHLAVWTEKLVDCGSRIILKRREALPTLAEYAAEFYIDICGSDEVLELTYQSKISGNTEEEISLRLTEYLEKQRTAELLKKRTLAGPHRDDMIIDIKGQNARKFASQGQKRSAAVSLKLAQAEFLARTRRDSPIVILDDVFSELDGERREKLCHLVGRKYQTFLASPQPEDLRQDLFADLSRYRVENGRITPE
jgi:DNA replication and repair protein RecF